MDKQNQNIASFSTDKQIIQILKNKAVLWAWHQEHCSNPVIQSDGEVIICVTCGRYVQRPQTINKKTKEGE